MAEQEQLDLVFHALADVTRRRILEEVSRGNPTVGELGQPFAMSAPAISKHLKVLERAGLLTRVKEGTVSRFRLNPERFDLGLRLMAGLQDAWHSREQNPAGAIESVSVVDELEDHLI